METLNCIIKNVSEGDTEAFAKLYEYYKEPGIRFTNSILKDKEEAENILQEVFIKIWNRRDLINPELNFNSYLFTCLKNMAFDYLRKVEKSQQMQEQYFIRITESPDLSSEVEEVKINMLMNAMSTLPKKRKMILKLIVEEGKSYQEIAEIMMISKNTVKNQLVKAKQFLKGNIDLSVVY